MGYAIAEAALDAGHDVILISGPVNLAPPRDAGALLLQVSAYDYGLAGALSVQLQAVADPQAYDPFLSFKLLVAVLLLLLRPDPAAAR